MARYQYQARDNHGELSRGSLVAATVEDAGRQLRAQGKFVIRLAPVTEEQTAADDTPLEVHARRVRRADVVFFAHQMAVMVDTGVPLSEALDTVAQQAGNPSFRAVLDEVARHVQGGGAFSAALARFPHAFPTVMVSLLQASELSGTMGPMLERISRYLDKEQQITRQARGALTYPVIMLTTAVGVTIFLLVFVLPKFASIYESRQAALPGPTRILMGISSGLIDHWLSLLTLLGIAVVGVIVLGQTRPGRRTIDWLKLNTPVIRNLFTSLYVTRATGTLGTMINAGVSLLDAIAIVRHVTDNVYYQDLWDDVDEALRQGMQLSDPLFRTTLIPRPIAQMIHSGEKSGRLGRVMVRVSEFTELEFDASVKTATQCIEPAMILCMGGLIGFIAIALLLPIFSVGRVMAGG